MPDARVAARDSSPDRGSTKGRREPTGSPWVVRSDSLRGVRDVRRWVRACCVGQQRARCPGRSVRGRRRNRRALARRSPLGLTAPTGRLRAGGRGQLRRNRWSRTCGGDLPPHAPPSLPRAPADHRRRNRRVLHLGGARGVVESGAAARARAARVRRGRVRDGRRLLPGLHPRLDQDARRVGDPHAVPPRVAGGDGLDARQVPAGRRLDAGCADRRAPQVGGSHRDADRARVDPRRGGALRDLRRDRVRRQPRVGSTASTHRCCRWSCSRSSVRCFCTRASSGRSAIACYGRSAPARSTPCRSR